MKKHLPLFLLILSCCLSCNNAPVKVLGKQDYSKVMFENDNYDEVLAASKAQKKPIFMDVYTTWCGWCRQLDNTTYRDPQVIKYLNDNFIPLKIDAEQGRGSDIARKYGVDSYPRMIFMNSTGQVFLIIKGYKDAHNFLKIATKALEVYNGK